MFCLHLLFLAPWFSTADLLHEFVKPCWHGTYNKQKKTCECDPQWRKSGPTDTIQFLKGACDQYMCSNDTQCVLDTGVAGAQCMVNSWNCACGWSHAFAQVWTGYEQQDRTKANGGGKCMGVLYNFSFSATDWLILFMEWCWKITLGLAIVFLPFGQTHVRCQHKFPDMFRLLHWTGALKLFGWNYNCDGRCTAQHVDSWSLYYDFAWSLYMIDFGVWLYCFLTVLWAIACFSWAIAMWLMVILILLVVMVVACIGGLLTCAGGGGGDCNCGSSHGGGDCCNCNGEVCSCCDGTAGSGAGGGGCADCCNGGTSTDLWFYTQLNNDFYYGPGPSSQDCCCSCRCYVNICFPVAFLILKFPHHPPNMHGGIFGRFVLRTHPASPDRYMGGSWLIDKLSFRTADFRDVGGWRDRVFTYLHTEEADIPTVYGQQERTSCQQPNRVMRSNTGFRPQQQSMPASRLAPQRRPLLAGGLAPESRVLVQNLDDDFDQARDHINGSSFEDFQANNCWVCQNSGDQGWDLWTTCGHMFCSNCSSEMIRRHMPCPLCRTVSITVKRLPASAYKPPA